MLRRFFVPIILFLMLVLVPATSAVFAQDATPELTPIVTIAATPVVTPAPAPALTPDNAISISTIVYGLIIALLGGGTVGFVLNTFGSNKANLDALEKLYQSASPETQAHIRQMFEDVKSINVRLLDIIDKVTDGQPNVEMLSKQVALSDKYLPPDQLPSQ